MQILKRNRPHPTSNCQQSHVCSKGTVNDCQKCSQYTDHRFTCFLKKLSAIEPGHSDDDDGAFDSDNPHVESNGPCPNEQQSVSLSGYRIVEFKKDLRPELTHVLCF